MAMPTQPAFDTDVTVIGAGLAGGVLALLLRQAGFQVTLIEAREPEPVSDAPDPRALAVTPASRAILEQIGVWAALPPERISTFHGMQVWDTYGAIAFDDRDVGEPALGYIIESPVLQAALEEVLARDAGLGWRRPAGVERLQADPQYIRLGLDNGDTLTARLAVGADGRQSRSRLLAGISYQEQPYPQKALAAVVTCEHPHEQIARQRFLGDSVLAFLPLADSHQCGIVWSTPAARADELLAMDDAGFADTLATAFERRLGAVTAIGRRGAFTLLQAEADRYVGERFALIGDAAHSIHPLAGQGANLGWLDAACLAEVLAEDAAGETRDPGHARRLRRYARWRRSENRIMQQALDGLYQLFRRDEWPLQALRGLGLRLTDHSGPLKKLLIRHAMGRGGDLPRIVTGKQSMVDTGSRD